MTKRVSCRAPWGPLGAWAEVPASLRGTPWKGRPLVGPPEGGSLEAGAFGGRQLAGAASPVKDPASTCSDKYARHARHGFLTKYQTICLGQKDFPVLPPLTGEIISPVLNYLGDYHRDSDYLIVE